MPEDFPTATGGGKEPIGVAMPFPKGAEALEQFGRDWNVAFVSAFGMASGDSVGEDLSVDVGGSDVKGFAESQTALVDGGEESPATTVAEGAKELADFLSCEDMREGPFAFDFDLTPDLPFEVEVISIEGAQGANGLVDGGGGEVAFCLKTDQEVENLAALECGKILVGIVRGELLDPAEVSFGGTFAQAFELDKAGEILIPLLGGDEVVLAMFFFHRGREHDGLTPTQQLRNEPRRVAALFNQRVPPTG